MVTIGDEHWASLSSAITGTPSSPSGDIVYLYVTSVKGQEKNKEKINTLAIGQSFSNKTGEFENTVTLVNAVIVAETKGGEDESDNTTAFNNRLNQLREWRTAGSNPIYLIMVSETDDVNLDLSYTDGGSERDYMKGKIVDFEWEVKSNVYYIKNLKFQECEY